MNRIKLKHINNKTVLGKFNILYLNINSIVSKLDELEIHLSNIIKDSNKTIHCVALTEMRIHEQQLAFFNIPSYTAFVSTRSDGYGGCALYVHDTINAHLIEKKSFNNIDLITVNLIELGASIIVVYKQPAVDNEFFINFMASYIENKQKFIAVGDMNLNLLNDSTLNKKYIDAIITNGGAFLNKVSSTYATRIATRNHGDRVTTSNSIIDHIFTDCIRFAYKLSYCDTTLSDHRELLLSIDNHKTADFIATDKLCRGQKMDMVEYNFDLHCFLSDTQINTFDELIDGMKCCKESNVHSYTYTFKVNPHKPWISNDLILLIQERKRYFLLLTKSPTNEYLKTKYDKI